MFDIIQSIDQEGKDTPGYGSQMIIFGTADERQCYDIINPQK